MVEFMGSGGTEKPTIVNLLAGVKYRLPGGAFVGVAYQHPVTDARGLSSQVVVQLEFMLGTAAH